MRRLPALLPAALLPAALLAAEGVVGAPAPVPAQAATATVACPAPVTRAAPDPARPRYEVTADVRPERGTASGTVSVAFTPDLPVTELVLRLWPNGPADAWSRSRPLRVPALSVDGAAAEVQQPDPSTLVVPLAQPVPAGRTLQVALAWTLRLPGARNDRVSRSGSTVRLGSFFPLLAWEPGYGWSRTPPTTSHAEATMTAPADLALRVTASPGLQVLATGVLGSDGWWRAAGAGDAAVAVGRFRSARAVAQAPGSPPVTVTVAVAEGVAERAEAYLSRIVSSLVGFSARYGPYPWPSYTVVLTPELRGGIEYPALVHQGPGSSGRTTPHEVAHQWFYGLVGNDQGRDPWLDEGLASWAEARAEGTLAGFRSRALPAAARGRLGAPMAYWDTASSAYYRGAYVLPVQALAALGPPDAVDCALKGYVAANAYRVARPADLVAALSAVFPDAPAVLARFGLRTAG